jgi:UDP-glucose 6-dehydrogenase
MNAANDHQKHVLGNKIKARFGNDLSGKHFAPGGGGGGLTFKASTDDMREASSRLLIRRQNPSELRQERGSSPQWRRRPDHRHRMERIPQAGF